MLRAARHRDRRTRTTSDEIQIGEQKAATILFGLMLARSLHRLACARRFEVGVLLAHSPW
jgi:hypothetical protein